jgi:hypothetical protein
MTFFKESSRGILRHVSFHHNVSNPPPQPEHPSLPPHPKPQRRGSVGNIVSVHRDRYGVVPDVIGHACQDLPDYDEATSSDRPHARMPLVKTDEGLVYLEEAFRKINIRLVDHLDIRDFASIAKASVKQNELYQLEDQGRSIGQREESSMFLVCLLKMHLKFYDKADYIVTWKNPSVSTLPISRIMLGQASSWEVISMIYPLSYLPASKSSYDMVCTTSFPLIIILHIFFLRYYTTTIVP